MTTFTTSLVVNFTTSGDDSISAEIDSRTDGFNSGKTSFGPGDEPAFLVFGPVGFIIDTIRTTLGGITSLGGASIEETEDLNFAGETSAALAKVSGSITSAQWIGNSPGTATLQADKKTFKIPNPPAGQKAGIGVLRVKYMANAYAYRLVGVPATVNGESSFPVLIVIDAHK